MAGSSETPDILEDRLNEEPVIFRGYADSELGTAIKLAAALLFPPSVVIGLILGRLAMALGVAMIGAIAFVYFGAGLYQRLKRGRPHFYLQQRVHLFLADLGFVRCQFNFRGESARFRFPDGSYQMSLGRDALRD